jgi:hypothetical protein
MTTEGGGAEKEKGRRKWVRRKAWREKAKPLRDPTAFVAMLCMRADVSLIWQTNTPCAHARGRPSLHATSS